MTFKGTIAAPWTPGQVAALNAWQANHNVHPFTCGRRSEAGHKVYQHDLGTLLATPDGWLCRDCDYRQTWAHDFMVRPIPDFAETWGRYR